MLGHFVGDFILQFDKIHELKYRSAGGLLFHVLIVFACLAAFCWPFLDQPSIWLFLIFVGITHYIQDWVKIKFTSRSKYGLFFFLLDQSLHILFISALFLTDLRRIATPSNDGTILLSLYSNNAITLYAIGVIIASYMSHFMIILAKKEYLKTDNMVSVFEKRYGLIERIIIFSAMMAGQLWLISIPMTLTLRPLLIKSLKDKLSVSVQFASWSEIILSGTAGILTGLIFYVFI